MLDFERSKTTRETNTTNNHMKVDTSEWVLVQASTGEELSAKVTALMRQGFKLYGEYQIRHGNSLGYSQALSKISSEEREEMVNGIIR